MHFWLTSFTGVVSDQFINYNVTMADLLASTCFYYWYGFTGLDRPLRHEGAFDFTNLSRIFSYHGLTTTQQLVWKQTGFRFLLVI